MPESPRNPEAGTPLEAAIKNFFIMAGQKTAGETNIRFVVAALLSEGTTRDCPRQKYIDNWSSRFAYDIDGTLMYAATANNEMADDDDDVPESEATDDQEIANAVFARRVSMVTDVTAFFVASQYSNLTGPEKHALLDHAQVFLANRGLDDDAPDYIGKAVAPYLAHEIDQVIVGNERELRIARGKAVLTILDKSWLMPNGLRAHFARRLKQAAKANPTI